MVEISIEMAQLIAPINYQIGGGPTIGKINKNHKQIKFLMNAYKL